MFVKLSGVTSENADHTIANIKAIRSATGYGLREAKYVYDTMKYVYENGGTYPIVELVDNEQYHELKIAGFFVTVVPHEDVSAPPPLPHLEVVFRFLNELDYDLTVRQVIDVVGSLRNLS